MPANTGNAIKHLELIGRVTTLAMQDVEYAAAQKRSFAMTERLALALQYYKENRLGDVSCSDFGDTSRRAESHPKAWAAPLQLRSAIAVNGECKIETDLYGWLSAKTRSCVARMPLRTVISLDEAALERRCGMDAASIKELQGNLWKLGLSLGMNDTQIEEYLGPKKVRLLVRVMTKSGEMVAVDKVIVESQDGTRTEESADKWGIFFGLSPGIYRIVSPKVWIMRFGEEVEEIPLEHETVEVLCQLKKGAETAIVEK